MKKKEMSKDEKRAQICCGTLAIKIVINRCYGGFGLSHKAMIAYAKQKGFRLYAFVDAPTLSGSIDFHKMIDYDPKSKDKPLCVHYSTKPLTEKQNIPDDGYFSDNDINRDDPDLVDVVERLGKSANDQSADLSIVEIPAGIKWHIVEYDGIEHVAEDHLTWS
jgi:hypothetical protein